MDKNFKPVYVQGTKTGTGVIEALEALGGINIYDYAGAGDDCMYFIMPDTNHICMTSYETKFSQYIRATAKEIKPLKLPRWRAKNKGQYYAIGADMKVIKLHDYRDVECARLYNCGNYFRTEKEAQEMAEKIKKVLLPD
jgi:hypothetical protein